MPKPSRTQGRLATFIGITSPCSCPAADCRCCFGELDTADWSSPARRTGGMRPHAVRREGRKNRTLTRGNLNSTPAPAQVSLGFEAGTGALDPRMRETLHGQPLFVGSKGVGRTADCGCCWDRTPPTGPARRVSERREGDPHVVEEDHHDQLNMHVRQR